jgi:hypothetical protein
MFKERVEQGSPSTGTRTAFFVKVTRQPVPEVQKKGWSRVRLVLAPEQLFFVKVTRQPVPEVQRKGGAGFA